MQVAYHQNTLQTWSEGLEVDGLFNTYKETIVNTSVEIFESKTPLLGLLAKDSKEKTSALIELMIIDLQSFVNVSRPMNEFQIRETARLIMQRYNFMKVADCKLVFDRIKTGQVKLYEGLDGQKILGIFEQWAEERWKSADEYNYNKHIERTSDETKHRDKPFVIGNPDAPEKTKVEDYLKAVNPE